MVPRNRTKEFIANNRQSINLIVILVVVSGIFFIGFNEFSRPVIKLGIITESVENGSDWNTYVNEEYDFSIDFPDDWRVAEDFERASPIINVYKPSFNVQPPFDYFSDVNAVSIFPKGVETEALIGETKSSEVGVGEFVDEVTDYVLSDGNVWATHMTFSDTPDSWKLWGSVWARVEIQSVRFSCRNGNKNVEVDRCNPFGGDVFVRTGKTDGEVRDVQEKIIQSFKFIN